MGAAAYYFFLREHLVGIAQHDVVRRNHQNSEQGRLGETEHQRDRQALENRIEQDRRRAYHGGKRRHQDRFEPDGTCFKQHNATSDNLKRPNCAGRQI